MIWHCIKIWYCTVWYFITCLSQHTMDITHWINFRYYTMRSCATWTIFTKRGTKQPYGKRFNVLREIIAKQNKLWPHPTWAWYHLQWLLLHFFLRTKLLSQLSARGVSWGTKVYFLTWSFPSLLQVFGQGVKSNQGL